MYAAEVSRRPRAAAAAAAADDVYGRRTLQRRRLTFPLIFRRGLPSQRTALQTGSETIDSTVPNNRDISASHRTARKPAKLTSQSAYLEVQS